jgi:hypothetical protein
VPKQHYQVSTYRAQNGIGYLMKRGHSLMLDVSPQQRCTHAAIDRRARNGGSWRMTASQSALT